MHRTFQLSKSREQSRPGRHGRLGHGAICGAIALALLWLAAGSLCAADVSGRWTGKAVEAGAGFPGAPQAGVVLEIAQNGSELTGQYAAPGDKPARIEGARIEDGRIVYWYRDSRNMLFTAALRISGDWMLGRVTSATGGVTNIALKKQ